MYFLVYQGGLANVFQVYTDGVRRRLIQHTFSHCEMFARGIASTGATVRTMWCNKAGDIGAEGIAWDTKQEDAPFTEHQQPVTYN